MERVQPLANQGQLRRRHTDGQDIQGETLTLLTDAIIAWSITYIEPATQHLTAAETPIPTRHVRTHQPLRRVSGYAAVLRSIEDDIGGLMKTNPKIFAFDDLDQGILSVRDFQTTGVVAYARGCPMDQLTAGRKQVQGRRVQVNETRRRLCVDAINQIVARL